MNRAIVESSLEALNLAKQSGYAVACLLCTSDGAYKITVYPDGEWINEDES